MKQSTVTFDVKIQTFKAKAGDFLWLFEDFYKKPHKVLNLQDIDTSVDLECPILIDTFKRVVQTMSLFQSKEDVDKFVTELKNVHEQYPTATIDNVELSKKSI